MEILKNRKILASVIFFFLLFVFIIPIITSAANAYLPLIQCGESSNTVNEVSSESSTEISNTCDFDDFIATINRIINWIISMAVVIFTISAAWGGFLYVTSGAMPGNKERAKNILWSTLTGFVIILVAWLIVYTILVNLTSSSSTLKFFNK